MVLSDKELINLITNNNKLKYVSQRYINKIKEENIDLYNNIINRYEEYDSIKEILYRLKNNIEIRPVCLYCGGHVKFIGGNDPWQLYCSQKCLHKDENHWIKCKETCKQRYNIIHYVNPNKAKQTKLERYGDEHFNNIESSRITRFEKYLQWNSPKNIEAIKNKSIETKQKQVLKSKQTKLERYDDTNYVNPDKAKQTKLERYGDTNYVNPDKAKQTKLERYGDTNYVNPDKAKQTKLERYGNQNFNNKEKAKQTCLEKYGVDCCFKLKKCRENNTCNSKESRDKAKQTSLNNFGKNNFNNREKAKQTCLERYGVTNKRKLQESRNYMSIIMSSKEVQEKRNNTLKQNKTYNTSCIENESYILLKEKYPDVKHQYISELYPFNCDFYIPSLDLYIECNYHWTHGFHPYNKNNIEDQNKLNKWKLKNTKYYNKAIEVWTIKDIIKRNIAKQNNLNYIELWNINELKNILNNL